MQHGITTLENTLAVTKLDIHIPYDSVITLLGIYSMETKTARRVHTETFT